MAARRLSTTLKEGMRIIHNGKIHRVLSHDGRIVRLREQGTLRITMTGDLPKVVEEAPRLCGGIGQPT